MGGWIGNGPDAVARGERVKTVLIVDDDPVERRLLTSALERMGHRVEEAEDGEMALARLARTRRPVDAVLLDLQMPKLDGMGVLEKLSADAPPVIVQTARGSIETVVSAMRAGAQDFVVKPASVERLKVALDNALVRTRMEKVVRGLTKRRATASGFDDLIADAPAMAKPVALGRRAAASNIPVLLEGESGTGKEVFARAIQGSGARAGRPFVTVNCGALPENLIEATLFGHEKGAFTGADASRPGKFREADGGTLFLDEVGELPPAAQVRLLRALQDGEIDPVGAARSTKVDVRVVSATNRDMIAQVREGAFREDLYYRLNVFPITLPPLRRRPEDVGSLAEHFLARFALEEGRRIGGLSDEAHALLAAHDWPGNVRQLENAIYRAVVLCDGGVLEAHDFPQVAAAHPDVAMERERPRFEAPPLAPEQMPEPIPVPAADAVPAVDAEGAVRPLGDVEADMIRFAIDHHDGRMTAVARALGMGRSTLYRRLKELGIDPNDPLAAATGERDAA